jgi:hypothetical protein
MKPIDLFKLCATAYFLITGAAVVVALVIAIHEIIYGRC